MSEIIDSVKLSTCHQTKPQVIDVKGWKLLNENDVVLPINKC